MATERGLWSVHIKSRQKPICSQSACSNHRFHTAVTPEHARVLDLARSSGFEADAFARTKDAILKATNGDQ